MPIDRNQVEPKLLITTTIHPRIPIQKLLNAKTLILSYVPLGGVSLWLALRIPNMLVQSVPQKRY